MVRRKRSTAALVAVGYVRVSTSKQDLSPAAQGMALERWAANEGATIAAVFFDFGVSGAADVGDRPGLASALAALRDFGATVLLVAKRDRVARDVRVASDVDALAARSKARVLSADGQGNGDSDGDALMRDLGAVLSAHERRLIRSRTRAALAVKAARGERVGQVPYGSQLGKDGVHLEPCEGEKKTIARAKQLSDGGLSVRAITATINAEGHRNRAGKPFAFQSVYNFLRPLLDREAA